MTSDESGGADVPGPRSERRTPGEQRRYNRRAPASDASPPYYETFERIAVALERIEQLLATRVIDLAAAEPREKPTSGRGGSRAESSSD